MPRWPFRKRHNYGPLCIDSTVEHDTPPARSCTCQPSSKCLTIFSIIWLLGVLSSCAGLIVYIVLKADMIIDKSIREFSIPNHVTSRRADALEAAIRSRGEPGMHLITKRSTDEKLRFEPRNQRRSHQKRSPYTGCGNVVMLRRTTHGALRIREVTYAFKEKGLKKSLVDTLRHSPTLRNSWTDGAPDSFTRWIRQRVLRWKLQLAFIAVGENPNIVTKDRLETIHGIEQTIRNHQDYQRFCWRDFSAALKDPTIWSKHGGCSPINSLLTYFYPTIDTDGQVYYNGLGRELADVNSSLDLAMSHESFFYFVGDHFNKTKKSGTLLHSEVFFGAPLDDYMDIIDRPQEQNAKFRKFITSYIDVLSKVSTDQVTVLYGGNEIYEYEVDHSFWSDMRLATVAVALVAILMLVLTSFSVWLTLCGLWSIVASFPLALFLYRVAFGVRALGILNGAAAFVIIGIGVDDVFVFINTFRQQSGESSLSRRLRVTLATAGKATFFTSFTTSAAFAANVASSIPAVHDFGLFMSLIVACCWFTVLIIMPPSLVLWANAFVLCESKCYGCCDACAGPVLLPEEMAQFLQNGGQGAGGGGRGDDSSEPEHDDDDDDDAQLLRMDAVTSADTGLWVDLDDDPLLQLENELEQSIQSEEGCSLIGRLQILIYDWLVVPIVKARWIIIGAFFAILLTCVGLITQLRVADRPPQFFKADSNLQKFYDLKANLSIDVLECYQCAALYEVEQQKRRHPNPPSVAMTTTSSPPPSSLPLSTTHATSTLTTPFYVLTTRVTSASDVTTATSGSDVTTTTTSGDDVGSSSKTSSMRSSGVTSSTKRTLTTTGVVTSTRTRDHKTTNPPTTVRSTTQKRRPAIPTPSVKSAKSDFKPCEEGGMECDKNATKPLDKSTAAVYVVFGIKDLDTSGIDVGNVLSERGEVIYDEQFQKAFNFTSPKFNINALKELCRLCKYIGDNDELVEAGTAQCLPKQLPAEIEKFLSLYEECRDLPRNRLVFDQQLPVRSALMFGKNNLKWIAFAFQSKTVQSESYFRGYSDYQKWERFIDQIKTEELSEDSPLKSIYQISPFWKEVFMEVLGVSSAVYGLAFSLVICVLAVSVFTGHILLLLVVMLSILGMIMTVVAMFYILGWQLGAVEAISLSILVGSSVDYCVHLVEGYLQAGRSPPFYLTLKPRELRRWRTRNALTRIGLSILSSALTTFVAALPLTQTNIQPFAQFGRIVAICTVVSIVYTLTCCSAFLATFAPPHFKSSWRSTLLSFVGTSVFVAVAVLVLYLVTLTGVVIPGPSGRNLFT